MYQPASAPVSVVTLPTISYSRFLYWRSIRAEFSSGAVISFAQSVKVDFVISIFVLGIDSTWSAAPAMFCGRAGGPELEPELDVTTVSTGSPSCERRDCSL